MTSGAGQQLLLWLQAFPTVVHSSSRPIHMQTPICPLMSMDSVMQTPKPHKSRSRLPHTMVTEAASRSSLRGYRMAARRHRTDLLCQACSMIGDDRNRRVPRRPVGVVHYGCVGCHPLVRRCVDDRIPAGRNRIDVSWHAHLHMSVLRATLNSGKAASAELLTDALRAVLQNIASCADNTFPALHCTLQIAVGQEAHLARLAVGLKGPAAGPLPSATASRGCGCGSGGVGADSATWEQRRQHMGDESPPRGSNRFGC